MTLALLVYLLPNQLHVEWAMAAAAIVFLPVNFFLPESPRWLLAKGKDEEAAKVIR